MMLKTRSFTLIETIMAMVLLAIISVTAGVFVTENMLAVVWSQDYACALNLGRMEMEVANNTSYASLSSLTTNNYQGYGFDVVRTVSFAAGGAGPGESLKLVTVEVRKHGSTVALLTLNTYIANNVTIGL